MPLYYQEFENSSTRNILCRLNDFKFSPEKIEGNYTNDFGIITKVWNPFSEGKFVFLFEGIHSYGLGGTGRLMSRLFIDSLVRKIKQNKALYWQVIIKTQVEGKTITPSIVDNYGFYPISKTDIYNNRVSTS